MINGQKSERRRKKMKGKRKKDERRKGNHLRKREREGFTTFITR